MLEVHFNPKSEKFLKAKASLTSIEIICDSIHAKNRNKSAQTTDTTFDLY